MNFDNVILGDLYYICQHLHNTSRNEGLYIRVFARITILSLQTLKQVLQTILLGFMVFEITLEKRNHESKCFHFQIQLIMHFGENKSIYTKSPFEIINAWNDFICVEGLTTCFSYLAQHLISWFSKTFFRLQEEIKYMMWQKNKLFWFRCTDVMYQTSNVCHQDITRSPQE